MNNHENVILDGMLMIMSEGYSYSSAYSHPFGPYSVERGFKVIYPSLNHGHSSSDAH